MGLSSMSTKVCTCLYLHRSLFFSTQILRACFYSGDSEIVNNYCAKWITSFIMVRYQSIVSSVEIRPDLMLLFEDWKLSLHPNI